MKLLKADMRRENHMFTSENPQVINQSSSLRSRYEVRGGRALPWLRRKGTLAGVVLVDGV